MNRRGFLAALFAVPVLTAPLLVPKAVADESLRYTWVVTGVDHETGTLTISSVPTSEVESLRLGARYECHPDDGESIGWGPLAKAEVVR